MPLCQPTASRSYPLCVSNTARARRPPSLLARGSVGDQSAHVRARVTLRVPYRNPNELLRAIAHSSRSLGALTGCCCALLRPAAPPRALSSQPYLEAPGCNPRVLGLLLHFFISRSWTARSSVLRWPFFNGRVCRAVPRVRNGQAVVSSIAEALVTNGCCSRRKGEC